MIQMHGCVVDTADFSPFFFFGGGALDSDGFSAPKYTDVLKYSNFCSFGGLEEGRGMV